MQGVRSSLPLRAPSPLAGDSPYDDSSPIHEGSERLEPVPFLNRAVLSVCCGDLQQGHGLRFAGWISVGHPE